MIEQHIAVTGANGFIGNALCDELEFRGFTVRRLVRASEMNSREVSVGNINSSTNWLHALDGISTVIHCAGLAHIYNDAGKIANEEYQEVNFRGTKRLAEQAILQGVKRLIFLSTIKVNGEFTNSKLDNPGAKCGFTAFDLPQPKGPYAHSKWEAEKVLWKFYNDKKLEIVIIRLPLVYGIGVKGNFLRLINLIRLGIPLPFGLIKNRRSLVCLDNLLDLTICCVNNPAANGNTFLVSDGEDLSTLELSKCLIYEMNQISLQEKCNSRVKLYDPLILNIPIWILLFLGKILGKQEEIERITGNLQVDISHTCQTLNWIPPISIKDGLRRMFSKTIN